MKNYRDTIDSIMKMAIDSCCFPGGQVYASVNGKVLINKAYGYFTYPAQDSAARRPMLDSMSRYHIFYPFDTLRYEAERPHSVEVSDIYDLASLTKVSATTIMVMSMVDQHKMGTARRLGDYLKNPYNNDAKVLNVSIRSLLEHRSGIAAWTPITRYSNFWWGWRINCRTLGIPFDTIHRKKEIQEASFNEIFSREYIEGKADRRVAEGIYMRNNYQDSLYRFYFEHGMAKRKKYVYSDINMIYLQWAAEKAAKCKINKYMADNFYTPLGLETTGYLPLERFPKNRIAPTEAHQWNGVLLQGDVHDPSAALLGGVSGNAGLFSSAQDLGALFEMLLNRGEYNGKRYLSADVVDRFTAKQPDTERGLGFDLVPSIFAADNASDKTFGHTGFTGPCAWADPVNKIVIVITNNRVYPSQENKKMVQMRIRKKICNAVYDGLGIK
ncbi:MAG: beta-lactamase family protein, partial [Bacteroidales bacterium]|nr:beta-lactamase family protein [Bacteroidales bacterium]